MTTPREQTTREMLRAMASDSMMTREEQAFLRTLADRIDGMGLEIEARQQALDGAVALGYLGVNHGEGESQHRGIVLLRDALARLDAPTSPPETPLYTRPVCGRRCCKQSCDQPCTQPPDHDGYCSCDGHQDGHPAHPVDRSAK